MITGQTAVTALASLISLGGLWVLYWWAYRDYRVDCLRQWLFGLRDEMFDQARTGAISFDDPLYGLLRTTINGFIRFAHKISLTRLAIFVLLAYRLRNTVLERGFHARWERAIRGTPIDKQAIFKNYLNRTHVYLVKHMLLISPLLAISVVTIIVPILVYVVWKECVGWALKMLRSPLEAMDSVAILLGAGTA